MNKIKQMLCIALTFILLGGCTQINKDKVPAETTLTEAVQTDEQTQGTITEVTASSETEQVATAAYTEKNTTQKQTTAKQTEKPSTTVTTTKKAVDTTAKAATTKAETTKATETTVTTTLPATTAPAQSEDGIIIGLKRVLFGSGRQEITEIFGSPTETVTEKLKSGGTVTSLVYADNYSEFAVFQLLNGKLFGFYTCVRDTLVTDGDKSYSIRTGGEKQIGNVSITEFKDSKNGGRVYAFKAGFNGFGYVPAELETLDGQERLIYHATNAIRALNGAAPLEYSDKAADCVRSHCQDMSARDYFSHDTPEGVKSSQRMRNCGIEYTTCGENLAAGYEDAFGLADGWYNSSGHRKNMLDEKYRYVGVGVAEGNSSYQIYAGQNYYA